MSKKIIFDEENPEIIDTSEFMPLKNAYPEIVEAFKNEQQKRRGRPPSERTKKQITVRLDPDIVAWLKSEGRGYQSRMNEILRQSMEDDLRK